MQWAAQGSWPPQNDGTDVQTSDALQHADGSGVLATGDNFGRLKLARFPCDSPLAQTRLYRGHGAAGPTVASGRGRPPRPAPAPLPAQSGEGSSGITKVRALGR
jgi:hypothetical protein